MHATLFSSFSLSLPPSFSLYISLFISLTGEEREREKEGEKEREREREGGREREKEGERGREREIIVIFIFKRNDGCLGTF